VLRCRDVRDGAGDLLEPSVIPERVNEEPAATATHPRLESLMVQLTPVARAAERVLDPFFARVVYDSPEFASSLQFKCIPVRGKSCT
jgi:hypothetical protein